MTKAADVGADPGTASPKPAARPGTKQALLIEMLKRPEGATADQIAERTGWQHHTIRGAIAGPSRRSSGSTSRPPGSATSAPTRPGPTAAVYRIIEAAW